MNLQELGSLLKQERERRGFSVRDVMDVTKISRRNLNALEDGEVKLLPHPVYLKGYVRNYARFVGLDPESLAAVVDEQSDEDSGYLVQKPSQPAPLVEIPSAIAAEPDAAAPFTVPAPEEPAPVQNESADKHTSFTAPVDLTPRPRKRLWPWILLLLLALGTTGLVYQCQRIQSDQTPAVVGLAVPTPSDNATNATDANATALQLEANATAALAGVPPLEPLAPASSASAAQSAAAVVPEIQGQPVAPMTSIEVSRKGQVAAVPAPTAPAAEVRTPGMQELLVVAKPGEVCWVEVTEGQRRKTFTIRNGDSRRFEFSRAATVRLGNAGGVSFQVNGSAYPYEGQRGQTATVEIGAR